MALKDLQFFPPDSFWHVLSNPRGGSISQNIYRINNNNIPCAKSNEEHLGIIALAALTAAFGSLHTTARNFECPTNVENPLFAFSIMS